ncbi:alkaline phosphatase family protein [Streptomyces sp. A0642]|uniref:alkaline phosphatase D family protein n=1 Tax=Streptomyces sp. A0642 TaxID=2563100 RepID=UPI0010A25677|nr:alkaline phosphatase D family protein [Streptomyces sp. A0642]THA78107.1 alkaline phosphatase family protein [Streptomyces sp. A0642]
MTELRLGPVLRYVDWETASTATVWVETDRPCTVEVRCADGASGSSRTFAVAGHHYALVVVTGLTPGSTTAYEVVLDDRTVWPPLGDHPFPPSTITTPPIPGAADEDGDGPATVRVAFGSCRWAAPPADGHLSHRSDPVGPDALDALAARLAADPSAARPDVLLLLGDQVYADETSEATRRRLAARRDLGEPPGAEVADYDEYTCLYDESWRDPEVRWLLSTVPSCMIFDDHDVIDDWNTSAAWLAGIRATSWWNERIVSGLMSYWVYQHLGNLSPAELAADPLLAAVHATPDGTEAVRGFAAGAAADPTRARWSYQRIFGRVRLLMVDSRAARVLDEQQRSMLHTQEEKWLRDAALAAPGSCDHLLIGTSLPWLLPPMVHDAEQWSSALCRGERGGPDGRWARVGEYLRQRSDLEHWAAFPESFERLTELIREVAEGPGAPATVCVLSGDVHHAYVAEPIGPTTTPGGTPVARVLQLTCSPVHNSIPTPLRAGFRFAWSRAGRLLGRLLARHGRTGPPSLRWHRTGGPWFGNQLMTLTLSGRKAALSMVQARPGKTGAVLERVFARPLTDEAPPSFSQSTKR